MTGKADATCDLVLNMIAAGTFPTTTNIPATCYVAILHTNPTGDDGTGAVETVYGSYARVSIVSTSTGWNAPADGAGETRIITNKLVLTFVTCTSPADAGVNGLALCIHLSSAIATSPEIIYWGAITNAPKVINIGDPVSVAAAALIISED
jgi:hypothetical protein